MLEAPFGLISLLDTDRQFFKSCYGLEIRETPRAIAFCAYTIQSDDVLVVPNALLDKRFSSNPLVTGPPGIRFYAGAPLITSTGLRLGSVCVLDTVPRSAPGERELTILKDLAAETVQHLEYGLTRRDLAASAEAIRKQEADFLAHRRLLQKTEARAAMALEAGEMGFWEWDSASERTVWSPRMEPMFGLQPGAYDGSHARWLQCVHPDDRPAADTRRFREEASFLTKYRVVHPDGAIRWIGERGAYQRDASGNLLGGFGVCWDATERENQVATLQASEELFRGLSASCPAGIYRANLDCSVTYANPRASAIWDMAADETLGAGWVDRVHADDKEAVVAHWVQVTQARQNFDREFRLLLPSGDVRWIHGRSAITYDRDGNPAGLVGTVDDITERKRAEQGLLEAKLEAEAASRTKDLFLANVSHELRTPLNGILGMTELLLQAPLTPDQRECAETVKQSGETLLAVVNDILDISKIEAGTLRIDLAPFDLRAAVARSAAVVHSHALAKNLQFSVDYPASLPSSFLGDSSRVQQILVNFLTNAIKFTDRGKVTCQVRINGNEGQRSEVTLAVIDTGCGISEQAQARLFQPFSQVDASATRTHGGVGLGLAISRRLAELMGGAVGFTSTPNAGSKFWLTLSMSAATLPDTAAPDAPAETYPSSAKNGRVLVAEDNAVNQRVVTRMLEKLGWETDVASDGHMAVDLARRNRYSVILMDCQMPEADGYAASSRIRAIEKRSAAARTPIIALTASAMPGDRERCLAAGMDDYISKPVTMDQLKSVLGFWASLAAPAALELQPS